MVEKEEERSANYGIYNRGYEPQRWCREVIDINGVIQRTDQERIQMFVCRYGLPSQQYICVRC